LRIFFLQTWETCFVVKNGQIIASFHAISQDGDGNLKFHIVSQNVSTQVTSGYQI